jgi:hypothetical protein
MSNVFLSLCILRDKILQDPWLKSPSIAMYATLAGYRGVWWLLMRVFISLMRWRHQDRFWRLGRNLPFGAKVFDASPHTTLKHIIFVRGNSLGGPLLGALEYAAINPCIRLLDLWAFEQGIALNQYKWIVFNLTNALPLIGVPWILVFW